METINLSGLQVSPSEGSINILESCLKNQIGFFETVIHNICDKTQYVVPHGALDILVGALVILVLGRTLLSLFR
jgi:hypothetical protein